MNTMPPVLESLFLCKPREGWTALYARDEIKGFGTRRFAKFTPQDEVEFTIGATETGMASNLNRAISKIISSAGLQPLERETTSGSRKHKGRYPAFSTRAIKFQSKIS